MPDISVRPVRVLISHANLFRRVSLPQSIRGQQSADLLHELCQILIPPEGKAFILLTDKP